MGVADVTILILTYKGQHHLEHLLPTVATVVAETKSCSVDVLIVDNGCHDDTRDWSQQNFPQFTYKYSPKNDYLFSLNPFMEEIQSKYVLILNDDMRMAPDVIDLVYPIISNDKGVFGVTCKIRDWDDEYTVTGIRKLFVKRGWLSSEYEEWNSDQPVLTLYPGGGAAIMDRIKYNEMGGFDHLYRPAYCEDLALGTLAWRFGYKVVYCPRAVLYHREGGTIHDQFKKDRLTQMINKNRILWMVACAKGGGFMFWFWAMLPWRLLVSLGNKNMRVAWWKSISSLPAALGRRKRLFASVHSDDDIAKKIGQPYGNGA